MSILAQDIVFYASENMPTDDTLPAGGAINSGVRVVFTNIVNTGIIKALQKKKINEIILVKNEYLNLFENV